MLLATRSSNIIPSLLRKYQPSTEVVVETNGNEIPWYSMVDYQISDFDATELPLQAQPTTWPIQQQLQPKQKSTQPSVPRFGVWTF